MRVVWVGEAKLIKQDSYSSTFTAVLVPSSSSSRSYKNLVLCGCLGIVTFLARRRRSERIPFQAGQASANGITGHAEAWIAREVAVLVWCSIAGRARKRADASVGRFD